MARPKKDRCVDFDPRFTYFKPAGICVSELEENLINVDELEAIRLSFLEGLSQTDCAEKLGVHQSTFQRILKSARTKMADSLINGKAMKVCFNCVKKSEELRCKNCNKFELKKNIND